jgi:Alpha/beta hydrolase domain
MGLPNRRAAHSSSKVKGTSDAVLPVDVPIAILSGLTSAGGGILCSLFGQTTPLSAAQLSSLYPTHDDYVNKVTAATMTAEQAGFILPADAPLIVQQAQSAPVPQ